MRDIFKYRFDDRRYGEYKEGEECFIIGVTYQDIGPVMWTVNCKTGMICGVNPGGLIYHETVDNCD